MNNDDMNLIRRAIALGNASYDDLIEDMIFLMFDDDIPEDTDMDFDDAHEAFEDFIDSDEYVMCSDRAIELLDTYAAL